MTNEDFQKHVLEWQDRIEKKLFQDNGNMSMQSKINRNSQMLKILTGVFTVVGTFVLSILGVFLKRQIGE